MNERTNDSTGMMMVVEGATTRRDNTYNNIISIAVRELHLHQGNRIIANNYIC